MICPQCQSEYREGFTACSTCEIPLVLSPENSDDERHIRLVPLLVAVILGIVAFIAFSLWRQGHLAWYWFALSLAVASSWATRFGMKLW
jgi:hypothetical protein